MEKVHSGEANWHLIDNIIGVFYIDIEVSSQVWRTGTLWYPNDQLGHTEYKCRTILIIVRVLA